MVRELPDMHAYEAALLVPTEQVVLVTIPLAEMPWAEFWLNPRMLRGTDFLMRWSQGVWSEKRLIEAVNSTSNFFALPYGPSGVAPEDPRGVELYFERLEEAGMAGQKRPDLLIFQKSDKENVEFLVSQIGGEEEIPFTSDGDHRIKKLLEYAIAAVECENSLWHAAKMPAYGRPLCEKRLLAGKTGLPKSAVLPTVIIKHEDVNRLDEWQRCHGVPIHVWHVFFDRAYGIAFDTAKKLFDSRQIEPTIQIFQAPGGATTRKAIYKIYYHYAYELASASKDPELRASAIVDKNGHVLPYVTFGGGRLVLGNSALDLLSRLPVRRGE